MSFAKFGIDLCEKKKSCDEVTLLLGSRYTYFDKSNEVSIAAIFFHFCSGAWFHFDYILADQKII